MSARSQGWPAMPAQGSGGRTPQRQPGQPEKQPYLYTIPIAPTSAGQTYVAADATVQVNYQIVNFPFRWLLAVATATYGAFSVQVYDQGRVYYFSPSAVNAANFWGTAQNPMPLLTPYTFQQNTQIQFTVNELSGNNNTIQLCLIGYQIVPYGYYGTEY